MSSKPWFHPLDGNDPREIEDMKTARAIDLPHEQHALMTGFGGPGQGRSCYLEDTTTVSYRVPPGVTDVDIEVWASGAGYITITSTVDAVGTKLLMQRGTDISEAKKFRTAGPMDSSVGAQSGRAVTVRTSATWEWTNVDLTLTASAGPESIMVLFIAFLPVHQAR